MRVCVVVVGGVGVEDLSRLLFLSLVGNGRAGDKSACVSLY